MAMEAKIPLFDLSGEALEKDGQQGSERWKLLCSQVREACESHGCFLLKYDGIPKKLREDMLMAMKELFDLPENTKSTYQKSRPYRSYSGSKSPVIPFQESFGIDEAPTIDVAQAFSSLMWPGGNPTFCQTINVMSWKMLELNLTILRMIFESFGTGKCYYSQVNESRSTLRLMKYKVPPSDAVSPIGLHPHTDKELLSILCQNDVQGLEIVTKDGDWAQVVVPEDAFIVFVGDILKAWSNGRLLAARHRVVINGGKERYSCGLFSLPDDEAKIEVPDELVDNEHPLLYKPFKYGDYLSYFVANTSDDALEIYAGV